MALPLDALSFDEGRALTCDCVRRLALLRLIHGRIHPLIAHALLVIAQAYLFVCPASMRAYDSK